MRRGECVLLTEREREGEVWGGGEERNRERDRERERELNVCDSSGHIYYTLQHAFHYEELKSSACKHELLFEKLLVIDVKKTAANDDNYFVFEDTMHQVCHIVCYQ